MIGGYRWHAPPGQVEFWLRRSSPCSAWSLPASWPGARC